MGLRPAVAASGAGVARGLLPAFDTQAAVMARYVTFGMGL